jgi:hypothetical protein
VELVLKNKPALSASKMSTAEEKFRWIDALLADTVEREEKIGERLSKFDRLAVSRRWGKWIAFGMEKPFCDDIQPHAGDFPSGTSDDHAGIRCVFPVIIFDNRGSDGQLDL